MISTSEPDGGITPGKLAISIHLPSSSRTQRQERSKASMKKHEIRNIIADLPLIRGAFQQPLFECQKTFVFQNTHHFLRTIKYFTFDPQNRICLFNNNGYE